MTLKFYCKNGRKQWTLINTEHVQRAYYVLLLLLLLLLYSLVTNISETVPAQYNIYIRSLEASTIMIYL